MCISKMQLLIYCKVSIFNQNKRHQFRIWWKNIFVSEIINKLLENVVQRKKSNWARNFFEKVIFISSPLPISYYCISVFHFLSIPQENNINSLIWIQPLWDSHMTTQNLIFDTEAISYVFLLKFSNLMILRNQWLRMHWCMKMISRRGLRTLMYENDVLRVITQSWHR